jgi:uncharacterized protein
VNKARVIEAVLRNPINRIILERLPTLDLNDLWLVSGSLFQTIWNCLTGRSPDYGIKDYDIFYFDPDTSWAAEDAAIRRTATCLSDVDARIELRNQGRVHLWYPEKFGTPYPPLQRATDGIDRFLVVAAQVGIRLVDNSFEVYAPHGFNDVATLTVRPHLCPNFRADLYEAKAASWKAPWPELLILPATGVV